jgi:hypothetical protein
MHLIVPLLYSTLASTCFGSSLPSSWSLLDPPELLEIQIGWVVYHNVWLSDLCAGLSGIQVMLPQVIRYATRPICISSNSGDLRRSSLIMAAEPRHSGTQAT